jgi:polysaccharide export outer membrane protein
MSKIMRILLLITTLTSLSAVNAGERYTMSPGDVLEISVWNEPSLQKEVIILPDGYITFPLAGEIVAANRTITEVEKEITEKLSEYLAEPVVTLTVKSVGGNQIYILGKAGKRGPITMSRELDVLQVMSIAGTTPYAEENNIFILRREGGEQKNYSD